MNKYFIDHPEVIDNKATLKGVLKDFYLGDDAKVNLMIIAYDLDIHNQIINADRIDEFFKQRFASKLTNLYSIQHDRAMWAVNEWVTIFNSNLIESYKNYLVDKEKELSLTEANDTDAALEEYIYTPEQYEATYSTVNDYNDQYINPKSFVDDKNIYIPCGFGNASKGFVIYGMKQSSQCKNQYASIYALVYNLLIKNTKLNDNNLPKMFYDLESVYSIDYETVYKMTIIILMLIKNNYGYRNIINIKFENDTIVDFAINIINYYATLFSKISGIKFKPLIRDKSALKVRKVEVNEPIYVNIEKKGKGIYCLESSEFSNVRYQWFEKKIKYNLTENNLKDVEKVLMEISPYSSFKEGQYEMLCEMISADKHKVAIMPTGSGKSLIFYLVSYLQPLPLYVICPTDILIQDQIRNLDKIHNIDDVAHLKLLDEICFRSYHSLTNRIHYLTPETFQNRDIIKAFQLINQGEYIKNNSLGRYPNGAPVSYIVLDEIHCISNWGHDFRPEYLMLSQNLNNFLDRINFLGFTATANFTVVSDIQSQLQIKDSNFLSPTVYEKDNFSYSFVKDENEEAMYTSLKSITDEITLKNERALVFCKTQEIGEQLVELIGYEADLFNPNDPESYYQFAQEKCSILVANSQLGIGINLPNVQNVIHFGIPTSKNEFVQEIGRAGRNNETVNSYVIYLDKDINEDLNKALVRDVEIDSIQSKIKFLNNDYSKVYNILIHDNLTKDELFESLIDICNGLKKVSIIKKQYPADISGFIKRQLFMLYVCGFIDEWFTVENDVDEITVLINVCATGYNKFKTNFDFAMFKRMKTRMLSYFDSLGNNRPVIAKINRAKTINDFVRIYVEWYYDSYLYKHHEEFLDLLDFIENNLNEDSFIINEDIKNYFILPFTKLKDDEASYKSKTIREIGIRGYRKVPSSVLVNLERANANNYSYKLDYAIFTSRLTENKQFDSSRLQRLLSNCSDDEKKDILYQLESAYYNHSYSIKLIIHKFMYVNASLFSMSYDEIFNDLYKNKQKDKLYYGIIAKRLNKKF